MNRVMFYQIFLNLFVFSSCNSNNNKIINSDSNLFINKLNIDEITLPKSFILTNSKIDTLDFFTQDFQDSCVTKLFFKNNDSDTLAYPFAIFLTVYKEGDLDGDGFEEIGVLPAYKNSACRNYEVYTLKNGNWKIFKTIYTHLPDRTKGVDYIKVINGKIRIIEAKKDLCCQCEGLDTIYQNLK